MFHDILERKKSFYAKKKTRSLKSQKITIFPQRLVHGIGQKLSSFHPFIQGKIGQENVFHDIVERENAFCKR